MTEVVNFIRLLLKEKPVYIALILMITGTGVIFAYFLKNIFRPQKSRIIWMIAAFLMSVMVSVIAVEPEVTYVKIQKKRTKSLLFLRTARSPHLKHNRQGYSGQQKMPGPALMG